MAPHVLDMAPADGDVWLQRLAPFPGRLDFALRLSLICALTTFAVEIYQTPSPALTIYLVFFLNKPDRMGSVIANLALIVVISVVIALLFPLVMAVIDQPPLRIASMALLSFTMLFLASASKLKPIGGTLALIAAYTLDLLGSVQMGELATRGLLYAWLFIAIPAGVSLCVNLLMAPAPRALVEAEIARRLRLVSSLLVADDAMARRQLAGALQEGNADLLKHLKMASLEKSLTSLDAAKLMQAGLTSFEMFALVDTMNAGKLKFPATLAEGLRPKLEEMALYLGRGACPPEMVRPGQDMVDDLPPETAEIINAFKTAVDTFTQTTGASAPSGGVPKKSSFFLPDAFTNPDHIRHALKATAAAMICYLTFQILDWPGIHTALITCYIVSLGTTAVTVDKLGLRIAGCLIGALAGVTTMVFLIPDITSIGGLMIVVFLGAFPAAWIAVGSPRIAYAGYQIVFAFLLCVVQGSLPDFDLTLARDRVIGILLGNVVTYLIFVNVWPVSVSGRINHVAARLLRELSGVIDGGDVPARLVWLAKARETLSTLARDLEFIGYEPKSIRPADEWIATRKRGVTDLASLCNATLMLGLAQGSDAGDVARDLNALANRLAPAEAPGAASENIIEPHDKAGVSSSFRAAAKTLIGRIDKDFRPEDPDNAQVRHATA